MSTNDHSERRAGSRVNIRTGVYIVPELEDEGKKDEGPVTLDARTINISQGGAQLGSDVAPAMGATVILVFIYPERRNPMVMQASVVWIDDQPNEEKFPVLFGVQFVFTSEEQKKHWTMFMELVIATQEVLGDAPKLS